MARARNLGAALVAIAAVSCGLFTLAGFFGGVWWMFDMCSHFRVQYALGLLVCTTICVATRHDVAAGLCAGGLALNIAVIAPLHWGGDTVGTDEPRIHVVSFNINDRNTRYDAVIDYLRSANADLMVILEVTEEWDRRLRTAFPSYYGFGEWRTDSFGLLVLSRLPVTSSNLIHLGGGEIAAVELTVEHATTELSLLAVHTLPPVNAAGSRQRDVMMKAIGTWANARAEPSIVVGDLNATPWSKPFRALLDSTTLKNSQRGFGPEPTWPGGMPLLGVALDHCLVTESLLVADRHRGPFLGSDHRVLHVQLARRR